ncbi:S1 RNA-binding domain-containing protein, partial [Campylobacter jejuni]
EGVVKKITTYGMFVDVGGVDGLVHYSEISYKGPVNPSILYKEGDKVPVKVVKYDKDRKHLSLSIKAALPDPWGEIKDSLEVGDTIKVIVSNIEPYGAFVDLGNDIEGFLHISEISWD